MHFLSHIGQDLWVCEVLKFKKCGYFLDFGGFEGLLHSNTYYLEKFLGWRGILVEPNPGPYASACAVRSCVTVNAALWKESRLSLQITNSHGLSSLVQFADRDANSDLRRQISKGVSNVDTINPTELLRRFDAPEYLDYLSLDVEGAELIVLEALDFQRYKIGLMSVEHNHDRKKQEAIRRYLKEFDYHAIEHRNDDFFFNLSHLHALTSGDFNNPQASAEKVLASYRLLEY